MQDQSQNQPRKRRRSKSSRRSRAQREAMRKKNADAHVLAVQAMQDIRERQAAGGFGHTNEAMPDMKVGTKRLDIIVVKPSRLEPKR